MARATSSTDSSPSWRAREASSCCVTRRSTVRATKEAACSYVVPAVDAKPSGPMPERRSILVVDDNGPSRDAMGSMLSTLGFWTEGAADGAEASPAGPDPDGRGDADYERARGLPAIEGRPGHPGYPGADDDRLRPPAGTAQDSGVGRRRPDRQAHPNARPASPGARVVAPARGSSRDAYHSGQPSLAGQAGEPFRVQTSPRQPASSHGPGDRPPDRPL